MNTQANFNGNGNFNGNYNNNGNFNANGNRNRAKTKIRLARILKTDNSYGIELKLKARLTKDIEFTMKDGKAQATLNFAINGVTDRLNTFFNNAFDPSLDGIFISVRATNDYDVKELENRGYKKGDMIGLSVASVTVYTSPNTGRNSLSGFFEMDFNTAQVSQGAYQNGTNFQSGEPSVAQQNTGFGQQNNGFAQQNTGFGQQNTGFGQQNTGFGQQGQAQQNTGFGQQNTGFGQQGQAQQNTGFGQQNTGFGQQGQAQQNTGFGQQNTGFGQQGQAQQNTGFGQQGQAQQSPFVSNANDMSNIHISDDDLPF